MPRPARARPARARAARGSRAAAVLGAGMLAGGLLTGCGGTSGAHATLHTAVLAGVGRVLVDSSGAALYTFAPDRARAVTCQGGCLLVWPPLDRPGQVSLGTGVRRALVGADTDPQGGPPVITYAGWPLYTFIQDSHPGQANGQGLDVNGGYWWVIRPDGTVVHAAPS